MCTELVRPGGTVANVGVHGKSVELHLQDLWIKNIAITMGLVSATTTPMLLKLVAQRKLRPERFVTHRFGLDRHRRRLRHVRPRRRDEGAQGRDRPRRDHARMTGTSL